jgi:hypothetical protein
MSALFAGRHRSLAFAVTLALGLLGLAPVSRADEHWDRGYYREHEFRERDFHERAFLDSRYNHDHYYPPVGFAFGMLPTSHIVVAHLGATFYFAGGVWYGAAGPGRFVVIAPPVGVVIPVLPPFYATVRVGGVPYYYANNAYYLQSHGGYLVVSPPPPATIVQVLPPSTAAAQQPPSSTVYRTPVAQLSVYPNRGQSLDQQAKDRYECNRWATGESGYDPTLNGPGATEQQTDGHTGAMRACLDARGYTVW